MYLESYGLVKNPFTMSPDPSLLYLTAQHREALSGLLHAVLSGKGLAVLTGEAGTGKTTLLRRMLRELPEERIPSSIIFNPSLTPDEMLEMALCEFGLANLPAGKVQRLLRLRQFLLDAHAAGRTPLLAIDEAHTLSQRLLEEIRQLSNFELGDRKLLQIVLIGQSELSGVLDVDAMRQLKQRIAVRLSIQALSPKEIDSYMRFRWTQCGGTSLPFEPEAVSEIAAWSEGIPRLINSLSDNALLIAFGSDESLVCVRHVHEAARDLHLHPPFANSRSGGAKPENRFGAVTPTVLSSVRVYPSSESGRDLERRSAWTRWASKIRLTGS